MAAVQPESKILIGSLLVGKYKVTRELGRGGMAAVYEAEHVDLGKRIALKLLAAELSSSPIVIERFIREARAAASVKSPYIVEVYDSGRIDDGRPFIAMELLEGESLYDRMARVRLIDVATTVRVIGQVCKGLIKAHAAGIVHRDLKPENIHLCKTDDGDEIAKILDFGLAKFYAPVEADEKTARLTREGAIFGTPAYMSPEQVKGQGSVDQRSDLWALGCMTYECLTGRPVWNTDQGVAMTFAAIASAALPVPSKLRPDLPEAFDAWFKKALERDPDLRFQSARELADELATALGTPLAGFGGTPSAVEIELVREIGPPPSPRAAPPSSGRGEAPPPSPRVDFPATEPTTSAAALGISRAGPLEAPAPAARPGAFALSAATLAALTVALGVAGVSDTGVRGPHAPKVAHAAQAPSAASSAAPRPSGAPETPRWMVPVEEGQKLLAAGDVDGALRKLKDSADSGGGALARSMLEQLKIGAATGGSCRVTGLAHPRIGLPGNAGRPAVAMTGKGAVVAWTDDHEQSGHDHVYGVLLDDAARVTSAARDLTPEADYAMRPELLASGERAVMLFWDKGGRKPGVKARWLDDEGRIGAMSIDVGASRPGLFWPAMDRAPDASGFWVAWQAGEKEGEDIFLRRLDAELAPQGPELRVTANENARGKPAPKAGGASVAVSAANVFVAYTLEHEHEHAIARVRLPLVSPSWQTAGFPETGAAARSAGDHGDVTLVSEDKVGGDYSAVACTGDACFLVWHEADKGGAQAALIDPSRGTMLWRKRFAPKGAHPTVAVSADGQAEVAYYEGGRVRVAPISRDGVGAPSTVAKVGADVPRPWMAPGRARGEWLVSWLDLEAGHTEPFLVRLQCPN